VLRYLDIVLFVLAWLVLAGEMFVGWRVLAIFSAGLFVARALMVRARKTRRLDWYPMLLATLAILWG
jgi:hypothetical protein